MGGSNGATQHMMIDGDGKTLIGEGIGAQALFTVSGDASITGELRTNSQVLVGGHLSLGTSATAQTYDLYCDDAYMAAGFVNQYIYHNGDTDTNINFGNDSIILSAGGVTLIDIQEAAVGSIYPAV